MSKPVKTEAEIIAMARAEGSRSMSPKARRASRSRCCVPATAGNSGPPPERAATVAKPGYPKSVAMIVQIGDRLSKQYDVKGWGALRRFEAARPHEDPEAAALGGTRACGYRWS